MDTLLPHCAYCGVEFTKKRDHQKFCSNKCSRDSRYEPRRKWREIPCDQCGTVFRTALQKQRFCSKKCSKEYSYVTPGSTYPGLATGTVGAIAELRVCAELMAKGYDVFRSVSQHCSCDIAILKNRSLLRVEVRTGYVYVSSGKRWTNKPKGSDAERFDIFATCYPDRIDYEPALP